MSLVQKKKLEKFENRGRKMSFYGFIELTFHGKARKYEFREYFISVYTSRVDALQVPMYSNEFR